MTSRNRAHMPFSKKIFHAVRTFSTTERLLFVFFFALLCITGFLIVWGLNSHILTKVPRRGGSLQEAVVGSPRFINPILALSDADEDLTSLIYSGLLRATPEGGIINDLSKEYTISPDGLEYTVVIRDDAVFHDGTPVTASDVEFTVRKAQDNSIKSPKRVNWDGVLVQKIDEKTIKFTLKQPYAPFIENLTMGILPQHMWGSLDSDQFVASLLNTEPIGSGPYKLKKVKRNSGGLPVYYDLVPFSKYTLGEPYIEHITLRFYMNEEDALEAYTDGSVDSVHGVPPQQVDSIVRKDTTIMHAPLPRVFGVFFNQNQAPLFTRREVRIALDTAIDRDRIVGEVLSGYGTPIDGPSSNSVAETASSSEERAQQARDILTRNGWKQNPDTGIMEKKSGNETVSLAFSISTGDAPELKEAAVLIKEAWEKIGADVEIRVFETSDLNQNIIRPRKYDALLFGEVIGRDSDLYPFWHASQRNDPGLNIALYANIKADRLLEEMRAITDPALREEKYDAFVDLLKEDMPAVFTYSPDFIYLVPSKVKNLKLGQAISPAERFMNVYEWYIETNRVWKIFSSNN